MRAQTTFSSESRRPALARSMCHQGSDPSACVEATGGRESCSLTCSSCPRPHTCRRTCPGRASRLLLSPSRQRRDAWRCQSRSVATFVRRSAHSNCPWSSAAHKLGRATQRRSSLRDYYWAHDRHSSTTLALCEIATAHTASRLLGLARSFGPQPLSCPA